MRGSVIARATATLASVDYITFQVSNATQGAVGVELPGTAVVVSYIDEDQVLNLPFSATPTTSNNTWGTNYLSGAGPILDVGERVEFTVNVDGLGTALATSTQFRIEVKPQIGAILVVERTIPAELKTITNLQ